MQAEGSISGAGLWLALDGIDATGKSTLLSMLASELRKTGSSVSVLPEFSPSPVGKLLTDNIAEKRFLALFGEPGESLLTDTCTLIADAAAKYEIVRSACGSNGVFLADRGILSLVAYQAERLHKARGKDYERLLLEFLQALEISPTIHILLCASESSVRSRIIGRGEKDLTIEEWRFLDNVQTRCIRLARDIQPSLIIDTSTKTLDNIARDVLALILDRRR